MPMTAVPARMYVRSLFWNSQAQDRHRVVSVPLVTALVEPDSRYSLHDPRDPPPAPPKPPALPKSPPSRGKPGRPRKFHVKRRDKDDPEIAKLLDVDTPIG